jgi:hypothetical protein
MADCETELIASVPVTIICSLGIRERFQEGGVLSAAGDCLVCLEKGGSERITMTIQNKHALYNELFHNTKQFYEHLIDTTLHECPLTSEEDPQTPLNVGVVW